MVYYECEQFPVSAFRVVGQYGGLRPPAVRQITQQGDSAMALSPEARRIRAEYQKNWRRQNPGRHKRYVETYWERKAERMREQKENTDNG